MAHDPAFDDVLLDMSEHVATITLHRPDRLNAITMDMLDHLAEVVRMVAADDDVRCVVITGSGRAFSAGLDFVEAAGQAETLDALPLTFDPQDAPVVALHQLDTPVVAAVNGATAGYAVGIAMNADIRVMARDATLVPATKRNLVPESGDTFLLPRLVGWEQAARFYFLGENMDGETALAAGVVSELADDGDATKARATEIATQIAAMPPNAVRAAKRMMRAALTDAYADHVQRAMLQLVPMFRTKDFAEAVAAFFEKREPTFRGE